MTDDQWDATCLLMENCWRGEFDDTRRESYRVFLDRYDPEEVQAALNLLITNGSPFLPAVPEIVQAIRECAGERSGPPSFTEAWAVILKALRIKPQEDALNWLRERESGDLLAGFVQAEGYNRLRLLPVDDPQYGPVEVERLRQRWTEFADVAIQREHRGIAQLAARGEKALGPHKPDFRGALPPGQGE